MSGFIFNFFKFSYYILKSPSWSTDAETLPVLHHRGQLSSLSSFRLRLYIIRDILYRQRYLTLLLKESQLWKMFGCRGPHGEELKLFGFSVAKSLVQEIHELEVTTAVHKTISIKGQHNAECANLIGPTSFPGSFLLLPGERRESEREPWNEVVIAQTSNSEIFFPRFLFHSFFSI